ncbi:hypothetical protein LOTGIDRAFT_227184 [Lottia gigantea]|uniref:E2 ubiquitin-conjugating enzyme n=1 Tax=Lottia gigantea TaxID=225164 RepID=V4AQC6_LOTGI|nr:hypothetical protein LOTGIDRAFT_227184 [Lottia gigantea]ESO95856.1 hypothetical protein LOTGIDRAFT_227184 [Lottia gigantea]
MNFGFYKRINKEWSEMMVNPYPGISYGPFADGWLNMQGTIEGQPGTVYEGGVFSLEIKLSDQYPFKAPKIKFLTKIYHPNISRDGVISIDVLSSHWAPSLTIKKVLMCILFMLPVPNPDDPLEPEIARIYQTNPELYQKIAREWTKLYAS